jgi:hypothetical protein
MGEKDEERKKEEENWRNGVLIFINYIDGCIIVII